jgi:hypothetical protein
MAVQYKVEISGATGAAIGSQLWVVNNSTSPVNLSDLAVRYYFTNEVSAQLTKSINWANAGLVGGPAGTFPTGNITISIVPMSMPKPLADTYVEFAFTGGSTLAASSYVQFSWVVQDFMSQNFNQTNDYSFSASATSQMDWQKVVLVYQGQAIAWGSPP